MVEGVSLVLLAVGGTPLVEFWPLDDEEEGAGWKTLTVLCFESLEAGT